MCFLFPSLLQQERGKRSLDTEFREKVFRCWHSMCEDIPRPPLLSAMLFTRIFLHFLLFLLLVIVVVIVIEPVIQVLLRHLQR